jgi:hypothetical protein
MDTVARKQDRTLLIVIATVVALVVVALVVVFTRGGAAPLDESTPAGVVQRYTQAVVAGDQETARTYLTSERQEECESTDSGSVDGIRVTLASTQERESTADVEVTVTYTSGGGIFGTQEYGSDERFELVRDGSRWAIKTAPWQFVICMEDYQ